VDSCGAHSGCGSIITIEQSMIAQNTHLRCQGRLSVRLSEYLNNGSHVLLAVPI
jgi:hypothetical protein